MNEKVFGKRRGIIWFGVPFLYWALAAVVIGGAYLTTQGGAQDVCLLRGCQSGYSCQWTGNPLGGFYQCIPVQGVVGELERLLYAFSLNNLFCGNAGFFGGFCNLSILLVSALIVGALGWVAAALFAPAFAMIGLGVGVLIGVGFSGFVALWWWLLLLVAGAIYWLTKK